MPYFFMFHDKMDRLAGIIQTTEFIYRSLPHLALGIIIAIAVIMFFRSRSRAKMGGSTGPDLSLRLAAVSSIIYAVMLLVLFFTQSLLMLYALFLKDSEFTINVVSDPAKEAFALLPFMLAILTCMFAVWQMIVSRWLLKGNIAARNILIGLWIWNFLMLSFPFVSCRAYGIIGIAAGAWTLWVIALRKDASEKISKGYKNLSLVRKTVLILVAALAIPAGVTGQLMTLSFKSDYSKAFSCFGSSYTKDITGRLEELYIMTGTDDSLTRMTADLLAEKITEKTGMPCKAVSSNTPLKINMDRAAALYIEPGKIMKPPFQNQGAVPKILRDKIPQSRQQIDFGGKKGLKIKMLQTWSNSRVPVKGLIFPNLYCNFSGTVAADTPDNATTAQQMVKEILKYIIPLLQCCRGENAVAIPEIKLPAQEFPPFLKLKGLKDARLIFVGEGLTPARLEVYSFKKVNYDSDLAIITEALKKRGFNKGFQNATGEQLVFRADRDEALLDMGRSSGEPVPIGLEISPEYGLLIVPVSRTASYNADQEFMDGLIKKDLKFFVLSRGLTSLKPELRQKVMREFFDLNALTLQEKLFPLQSLSYKKLTPEEKAVYAKAFLKISEEMAEQKDSPDLLEKIQYVKRISDIDPDAKPLIEQFRKKLSNIFFEARVSGMPDKEGLISKSFEFPVDNFRNFQKTIEISFENSDYEPIWFPLGFIKAKENLQITAGNISSSIPAADADKSIFYCQWSVFPDSSKRKILSSSVSGTRGIVEISEKLQASNQLLTTLSFDTKKKCVRLDVVFRLPKNGAKK